MTVSRVLRDKGYVSKSVTDKVLKAAAELGYVRNNLAGSFAGQSSNLIGVIIPSLSNSVFTEVLSGFEDSIRHSALQMAIGVSNYDKTREFKLVSDMLAWRPAGIVLTGVDHDERTRALLQQNGVKTVEIIDIDGDPISKCVGLSHHQAAETMARHLIERGHRKFGFVGSDLQNDERAKKRKLAFAEVLATCDCQIDYEALSPDPSSMLLGRELTAEILDKTNDPVALYYSNDDLAAGGLLHCLSRNLAVPDEVAIAGFNGLEFLDAMPMQITTYRSPRYQIGQVAGSYMQDHLSDPVTQIPGELVIGETT
ncbi:MAG: LacI family DNA-binding transcriptional regulator [Granulosicoccus sp.]|nr:LacI family DNA-binding transcriptional regulator [Granulosicoccus sp.]